MAKRHTPAATVAMTSPQGTKVTVTAGDEAKYEARGFKRAQQPVRARRSRTK